MSARHRSSSPLRRTLCLLACTLLLGCESPSGDDSSTRDTEPEAEAVTRSAEPLPENLDHQVATYLEQYGRGWPAFRFHGAVVVTRGDDVAVHRAFGSADLARDLPNDTDTLFRIGTLSAQLTAAAVMRLAEAGALKLDDPVSTHLPGWPGGDDTTIEHLLTHRSGIPNYTADLAFLPWKRGPRTLEATLDLFRGHPLEFEPGTDTDPSNSNYVLLGAVLEAVTKKPYEQVVREQVLVPLGLDNTHYAVSDQPQAIGMEWSNDETLSMVTRVHPSAFGPAGGWLSTSGDMMRFVRGLARDRLLPRHATMRMQGLTDDGLGYGWAPSQVQDHDAISWPGLIDGFNSAVLYVPQDDTLILVLSNSEVIPSGELVEGIAALCYGQDMPRRDEPVAMPLPIESQQHAVGRYVPTRGTEDAFAAAGSDTGAIDEVFVRQDGDYLTFEVPTHGRKRMHPLGQGRYFFKDGVQTRAEVIVRAEQEPLLVLEAGEGEVRFVRVGDENSDG